MSGGSSITMPMELDPPCANCAAPAKHKCARCKTAPYCGAPCQKAHWRAHKPECVAPPEAVGAPPLPPAPLGATHRGLWTRQCAF